MNHAGWGQKSRGYKNLQIMFGIFMFCPRSLGEPWGDFKQRKEMISLGFWKKTLTAVHSTS